MKKTIINQDDEKDFFDVVKVNTKTIKLQNIKTNKICLIKKDLFKNDVKVGDKVFSAKNKKGTQYYILEDQQEITKLYTTLFNKYVLYKTNNSICYFISLYDNFSYLFMEALDEKNIVIGNVFELKINKENTQFMEFDSELSAFQVLKPHIELLCKDYENYMFGENGKLKELVENPKDYEKAKRKIIKFKKSADKIFKKLCFKKNKLNNKQKNA